LTPGTATRRSTVRELRRRPLETLERARNAGDLTWLVLGRQRLLVVSHPAVIEELLVRKARSFQKERLLWGGLWPHWAPRRGGPARLASEDWATHTAARRLLQPAFASDRIAAQRPSVRAVVVDELARWPGESDVDVLAAMRRISLRSFAVAMLGLDVAGDELDRQSAHLVATLEGSVQVGSSLPLLLASLRVGRLQRTTQAMRESQAWLAAAIARSEGDDASLAALLRRSGLGTEAQAVEAFVVALAAFDTSASVLSWLCFELAGRPELRARLAAEWLERGDGAEPLPLARAVFHETLRLHPPSWFVARRAEARETIGGAPVPVGTTVVVSPYTVQRDARWFSDPDELRPDRWAQAQHPRFAFFPFGGGIRQCLGERLAWLEGELVAGAISALLGVTASRPPPAAVAAASLHPRGLRVAAAARGATPRAPVGAGP